MSRSAPPAIRLPRVVLALLLVCVARVAPAADGYSRDEVVALLETPADLQPAAGIFTQGEGNVVSHVQLLARALGIPNVVLGPRVFARFSEHDGKQVFFVSTPGGRVVLKRVSGMTEADRDFAVCCAVPVD